MNVFFALKGSKLFIINNWVGVKIPQSGYFDPNPLSLSADVTKFHRFCQVPKYSLQIHLKTSSPMGNDAHLRAMIQSEKKMET